MNHLIFLICHYLLFLLYLNYLFLINTPQHIMSFAPNLLKVNQNFDLCHNLLIFRQLKNRDFLEKTTLYLLKSIFINFLENVLEFVYFRFVPFIFTFLFLQNFIFITVFAICIKVSRLFCIFKIFYERFINFNFSNKILSATNNFVL